MKENKSTTSKETYRTFKKKNVVISNHHQRYETEGEVNNLPSLTVPDQTLSLRQLLERYTRGQGISIKRDVTYSEEDFTDLEKMDKFERADLKSQNQQYIDELRQELQQQQSPPQKTTTKEKAPEAPDPKEPRSDDKGGATQ